MHSLVPLAVEELRSFRGGDCHGCRELRQQLKEGLMQYLLAATWMNMNSPDAIDVRTISCESVLAFALTEFHQHRKDTHFADYYPPPWTEVPARNAS